MSAIPPYPQEDGELIKLDRAHTGYEKALAAYRDDLAQEKIRLAAKHNPFIWAAQSVLYEAMGNAALAGFSPADMVQTMGCDNH